MKFILQNRKTCTAALITTLTLSCLPQLVFGMSLCMPKSGGKGASCINPAVNTAIQVTQFYKNLKTYRSSGKPLSLSIILSAADGQSNSPTWNQAGVVKKIAGLDIQNLSVLQGGPNPPKTGSDYNKALENLATLFRNNNVTAKHLYAQANTFSDYQENNPDPGQTLDTLCQSVGIPSSLSSHFTTLTQKSIAGHKSPIWTKPPASYHYHLDNPTISLGESAAPTEINKPTPQTDAVKFQNNAGSMNTETSLPQNSQQNHTGV